MLPAAEPGWVGSCENGAGWRCYFEPLEPTAAGGASGDADAKCAAAMLAASDSSALWTSGAAWGLAARGGVEASARPVVVWSACGNQMQVF